MALKQENEITEMFNNISKTYDRVNSVLSFGLHKKWRQKLISALPKRENLSLLDCATGTGDVLIDAFKAGKIKKGVGIDLANEMLEIARQKSHAFENELTFQCASALELPFEDHSFDCTSISFGIRNVQSPVLALKEMYRVLKPHGWSYILEFSLPQNFLLKKGHLFYLRAILPKLGGWISKNTDSYEYLNKTIETFPYGDQFLKWMEEAKFSHLSCQTLLGGVVSLYRGQKEAH